MQVFENQALAFCLVPGAGIEPARIAPLVFETSASTDSAIRAFGASSCSPLGDCRSVMCQGDLAIGGQDRHIVRVIRERLEVDLPVKAAKVSDFSENPKYFYLTDRSDRVKFPIFVRCKHVNVSKRKRWIRSTYIQGRES